MKGLCDQWVKDRIIWAAKKNGLPSGKTFFIGASFKMPPDLQYDARNAGLPVLAIIIADNRWTVMGTEKILTNEGGKIEEINLDDINDIKWPTKDTSEKSECDTIIIEPYCGEFHRICVPPGREFYALFNILLRLKNLRIPNDGKNCLRKNLSG